jgi:hypothetical protein
MNNKRTHAPLFPVRRPEDVGDDRVSDFFDTASGWRAVLAHTPPPVPRTSEENRILRTSGDRWRFALVWQYEPRDQFTGIEQCPCITEPEMF